MIYQNLSMSTDYHILLQQSIPELDEQNPPVISLVEASKRHIVNCVVFSFSITNVVSDCV